MSTPDIVFDPNTGLPQLPEDFVFVVARVIVGYNNFEVTDYIGYSPIYQVSIQHLEPQRRKEDIPVYKKGWFGKILVGMEPGELIPREPDGYILDETLLVDDLDDSFSDFPTQENKKDYEELVRQYKNSGTKIQKFRRQELNDENIKKAAIQCFLYWKERCRRDEERELEAAAQRALEDKYCGTYPPKGINIG